MKAARPRYASVFSAACREEEQVHGLAVGVERIREARQVQQDERELEGPPSGWAPVAELIAETLAEERSQRHGSPPGTHRERPRPTRAAQFPARFCPPHGGRGPVAYPPCPAVCPQGHYHPVPSFDPGAVRVDERSERGRGGRTVVQCTECLHRKFDTGDGHGLGLLDGGARNPGRPQPSACAVDDVPVRGHAVAGGECGRVRVVEIGDLLVRVQRLLPAQVRSGHEGSLAPDLDLGLEGVCEIGIVLVRLAPVHQEDGDGTGSGRDTGDSRGVDGSHVRVQPQVVVFGNAVVVCSCHGYRHGSLALPSLPGGSSLAVRVRDWDEFVARPSDDYADRVRVFGDQEAQAHRGGEEALLCGLALLRGLLGEPGRFRHLAEIVLLVRIAPLLGRRTGRDEESGQVPVRGAHPSW